MSLKSQPNRGGGGFQINLLCLLVNAPYMYSIQPKLRLTNPDGRASGECDNILEVYWQ